jgi:TolB protein
MGSETPYVVSYAIAKCEGTRFIFPMLYRFIISTTALFLISFSAASAADLGVFQRQADIGPTRLAGSAVPQGDGYLVTASGENMWGTNDTFHFVWKKVSDDVSLAADIAFLSTEGNPHRKACLIVRQDLDPDSVYADAAVHGNGLTSLQYRETKGGRTLEAPTKMSSPKRLQIEKRGENVSISVAGEGKKLEPAAGPIRLSLKMPFFVGLGLCSHDSNAVVKATFSKVELTSHSSPPSQQK